MLQDLKLVTFALIRRLYAGCRGFYLPPQIRRMAVRTFDWAYRCALPSAPYLVNSNGHAMFVSPLDRDISRLITLCGDYEPEKRGAFLGCLREGMIVFDIGANIGDYTLVAARAVGKQGAVYAFEPDATNFSLLVKNISMNGYENVTCVCKALSNTPGRARFYRDGRNLGCHSLAFANTYTPALSDEVETSTIDRFVKSIPEKRVDFLKIDAQGAEGLILEGAADTLARLDVTIMAEFWPWGLLNMGTDPRAFIGKLRGLGYAIRLIRDDGLLSVPLEDFPFCNSICDRTYSVDLLLSRP